MRSRPLLFTCITSTLAALLFGIAAVGVWLDRNRSIMGDLNGARLRQIGAAITQYAQDHAGAYPDSLTAGPNADRLAPEEARCPASSHWASGAASTFVYLGRGLTTAMADGRTVLAYAPLASEGGTGSAVLFGDGHTEWFTAGQLPAVLSRGGPATRPATGPAGLPPGHG